MRPRTESVSVLYIMGWGRSGSTILDNLLGAVDGFFSAGELRYVWERGLIEGRRCGCGNPIAECAMWTSVFRRGWGGPEGVDAREVVSWQARWARVRDTRRLLRLERDGPLEPSLGRLVETTGRLYQAIAGVTGARVIVDSSKRPSDAALLRLIPGVAARFVHLVRDPRAVAYSWQRRKAQPDRNRPAELVRHGVVDSTVSWMRWNTLAEAVRRREPPSSSLLLRYEDLVARPRSSLQEVAALVRETPRELPFSGEHTASLEPNHTVSGNPSRFRTGRVEISADTEWIARQSAAERLIVTSLALPLLSRYGYGTRIPGPLEAA